MSGINSLPIKPTTQNTAFDELQVANLTAKICVQFPYNINAELLDDNSSGSGGISVSDSFCNISSGAASSSSGKITSKAVIEYHPGTGGICRFAAVYDTPVANNVQLVGIGTDDNGVFIGHNGTDFVISRRKGGTDNFTTQANFSNDKLDGTGPSGVILDPTKGNVFQIQYSWLGFSEIRYLIANPNTGTLIVFHRIEYGNANTEVSLSNPTLPFYAESTNTTNTTDVILKVPSAGVYSEGEDANAMHLSHGADATKSMVTTEVAILSIRNNTTFASVDNFLRVQPKIVAAAADGSKPAIITCYKNPTLGGTPAFVDFNSATSPVAIDVAGTTISSAIKIAVFTVAKSDNNILYLTDLPIMLAPGEIFTVAASSSANTDISASITWEERFS